MNIETKIIWKSTVDELPKRKGVYIVCGSTSDNEHQVGIMEFCGVDDTVFGVYQDWRGITLHRYIPSPNIHSIQYWAELPTPPQT